MLGNPLPARALVRAHPELAAGRAEVETERLAAIGEIYFWVEEDRIIVPFGRTPISAPGECRLASPSNVIGRALDDVTALGRVQPGAKVSLIAE